MQIMDDSAKCLTPLLASLKRNPFLVFEICCTCGAIMREEDIIINNIELHVPELSPFV